MAEIQEYTLTRTGERPLKFKGEVIAEAGGHWHVGQEQNRWHEIRIYKTAGGKHVLEVEYCTCWQGEDSNHRAIVYDTLEEAVDALEFIEPLEHLIGFPPHPQFAEKQARLEDSLRQRWGTLLSDVLGEIPDAAEEIE